MPAPRLLYVCDGCGKRYELWTSDASAPGGWFFSKREDAFFNRWDNGPWSCGVVACSADCIATAKENTKKRGQEAVERWKLRVDGVRMERIG